VDVAAGGAEPEPPGMLGTVRAGPSAAGAARTVAARARSGRKAIMLIILDAGLLVERGRLF
jgi:hypothetical protein